MLKKVFFLIFISLCLTSCQVLMERTPEGWGWTFKPRPLNGIRNFPSTKSEYGKGFRHGCGAALDAVTKGILSDVNDKRYDYKRATRSPDYNAGWFDGFEQCTYITDWNVV